MDTTEQFVEAFVGRMPEVLGIYAAHMDDNDVLLPHVFMGDVARFVLQTVGMRTEQDVLRRLFLLIEEGLLARSTDVANFIAVGFIENLAGEKETVEPLFAIMGYETRRELHVLCGY